MITIQEELYRKALDQMAHLVSAYESERISADSLRTGLETIWACLGGVVSSPAFDDIMREANAFMNDLPPRQMISVYERDDKLLVLCRKGERAVVLTGVITNAVRNIQGELEDHAVATIAKVKNSFEQKGYVQV